MQISIPTLSDNLSHYQALFSIYSQAQLASEEVYLDFSQCRFLKQNGVVLLGALSKSLGSQNIPVIFKWDTMIPALHTNLAQNGFMHSHGSPQPEWSGNSIPYRCFGSIDTVLDYLKLKWLGRGFVNLSPKAANFIAGRVVEVFDNAFSHSESSQGVFACGQHFPRMHTLSLTVADIGVGIAHKVKEYWAQKQMTGLADHHALEIAFQHGFTTRSYPSGLGLSQLKQFINVNDGRMQVFSNNGYVEFKRTGDYYTYQHESFKGTLINIDINCDEYEYRLAEELDGN